MSDWNEFVQTQLTLAASEMNDVTGRIQRFGDLQTEYDLLRYGPAIVDRQYASILEITGADRAAWLHNLTTNQVKNLGTNEGVYAFALNVQGRILFDLQVLNLGERIWCVINHSFIERAESHFDKYVITEDVTIANRSGDFVRLGLSGQSIPELLERFGIGHVGAMPSLGVASCRIAEANTIAVRNNFCGAPAIDLFVPRENAVEVWNELASHGTGIRATPIGDAVVEIARIEAALPCPLKEISEDILPAETGQFDRAVSYTKGCYLGQEIVERMRSRGVVARRLSGINPKGETPPPSGATVSKEGGPTIGTVTSSCVSLALGVPIALAYLKTGSCDPGAVIRISWDKRGAPGEAEGEITTLPFVGAPVH